MAEDSTLLDDHVIEVVTPPDLGSGRRASADGDRQEDSSAPGAETGGGTTPAAATERAADPLVLDLLGLEAEARKHRQSSVADCLGHLRQAIAGERDLDEWDAAAIFHMIDPARVALAIRSRAAQNMNLARAEWARNVLILFPVLLTWLSLRTAVANYHAALKDARNATDTDLHNSSFLLLWDQGFSHWHHAGPFGWLTLSRVALIDVAIVLVIIAITGYIHWKTNIGQATLDAVSREFERRLHGALWRVSLRLEGHGNRLGLVSELRAERVLLERVTDAYHEQVQNLARFGGQFRVGAVQASKTFDLLKAEAEQLRAETQTLQRSMAGVAARETALTQQLTTLNTAVGDATVAQRQASLQASNSMVQLKETIEALGGKIDTVSTVHADYRSMIASLAETATKLQAAVAGAPALAAQLQTGIADMTKVVGRFEAGLKTNSDAITKQQRAIDDLAKTVGNVDRQVASAVDRLTAANRRKRGFLWFGDDE